MTHSSHNTVSLNSPCKNMHFILVVLVGNCVDFFSSWVSDLYVLISGSASATHGAYQNSGSTALYCYTCDYCARIFERIDLAGRVYRSLKLV